MIDTAVPKEVHIPEVDVIHRLRTLRQPVTLFGETELDRYKRLLLLEEKSSKELRKADRDETARSFIPEDEEVELRKFMK